MNESTDWISSNINKSETLRTKYNGVKGLLSLFIAYLRIIKPIVFVYSVFSTPSAYYKLKDILKDDHSIFIDKIMSYIYLYLFIEFILVIYAFKIGCSLLNIEVGSVFRAKRFLIIDYVISTLCIFGLVIYASIISGAPGVYTQPIAKAIAYSIWFIILFMYLKLSKRVKYTYLTD